MAENIVESEKPMQDIPLAESNVSKDVRWNESTSQIKAKSNSLRRFFKMPQRRPTDYNSDSNSQRDVNESFIEMDTSEKNKSDDEEQASLEQKHKSQRRFPLRLGSVQRQSGSNSLNRNVKSETGNFNATQSKSTLKSSLSSYWGLVFKKSKKNKSTDNKDENETEKVVNNMKVPLNSIADLDTEVEKIAESVLNEEVHALKISEDSDNN